MTQLLNTKQEKRLIAFEAVIDLDRHAFERVGNALLAIRDERLYLKTHDRFDDYCQERHHWSRSEADNKIKAAKVLNLIPDEINDFVNEKVAQTLAPLLQLDSPDVEIPYILERAIQRYGPDLTGAQAKTEMPLSGRHQDHLRIYCETPEEYNAWELRSKDGGWGEPRLLGELRRAFPERGRREKSDPLAKAKARGKEIREKQAKAAAVVSDRAIALFLKRLSKLREGFRHLSMTTSQPQVLHKFRTPEHKREIIRKLRDFENEIEDLIHAFEEVEP